MASTYLGPETPRPYSVISEYYRNKLHLPDTPLATGESFSYGKEYEDALVKALHKHLELYVTDHLCYVGEEKGSVLELLKHRFGLLEPVEVVEPGTIHYEETSGKRLLNICIEGTGAEEHFREQATKLPSQAPRPDRVVLYHCTHYFRRPERVFRNIRQLLRSDGRLLVVHRAWDMATLPVFGDATQRLKEQDTPYTQMLKDLQGAGFDVRWEVETLPIVMRKTEWLRLLREKCPPKMEALSKADVSQGLRELTERSLKYQGDVVEFYDRLLFITASIPDVTSGPPSLRRYGKEPWKPLDDVTGCRFTMEVTPDVADVVRQRQEDERQAKAKLVRRAR